MRIETIKPVGRKPVFDISVSDAEHYVLKNGVVTHNTGGMYSANQVFIITKAQEKDGTDLLGYKFTINIEKSRYVREKSKFPFIVKFQGGIDRWSGLVDIALECGILTKVSAQKYAVVDMETGEVGQDTYFRKELVGKDFWVPILNNEHFLKFVEERYQVGSQQLLGDEQFEQDEVIE